MASGDRAAPSIARRLARPPLPSSRRHKSRPGLEVLEGRLALSTPTLYTWSGLGDGTSFNQAANWDRNAVPPAGAAVDFPAISFLPKPGEYDLQLMSWGDGSKVPTSGQDLAIAGTDNSGLLHIRTFDAAGVRTDTYEAMEGGALHLVTADASGHVLSDTAESSLPAAQAQAVADLKQQLPGLLPPHVLSDAEREQVLSEATLITGQTQPGGPGGGQNLTTGMILIDDADVSTITASDSYTFLGDPAGANDQLSLDSGATITATADPTKPLSFNDQGNFGGLQVNFDGAVNKGGSGEVDFYSQNINYGELQLVSWGDGSGVPTSGSNLVIVGIDNNGLLHIRIFDADGNKITDTDETKLPAAQAGAISTLKQQLPGLLPPHVLTGAEKAQLMSEVTSIVDYTTLLPMAITKGKIKIGSSTRLPKTKFNLSTGTTLVVPDGIQPTIGSLSGNGVLELDTSGGPTQLTIATPAGESDIFGGMVDGSGGTLAMGGAGSLAIAQFNAAKAPSFQLAVQSGTLLVTQVANAETLTVANGATFGGPGTTTVTGLEPGGGNGTGAATFASGATFAVTLDGPGDGQYTQLINDDSNAADAGVGEVLLNGCKLTGVLGGGYLPHQGESPAIVSPPLPSNPPQDVTDPAIDGQFTLPGQDPASSLILIGGVPFRVDYVSNTVGGPVTAVTLTALASATVTQLTSLTNPSNFDAAVTFSAQVRTTAGPVTDGSVTFEQGGRVLATVPLDANGMARYTTSSLLTGGVGISAVYGEFNNGVVHNLSSSATLTQTVNPLITTTRLSSPAGPIDPGHAVTFTATVTTSSGPVTTGSVTFKEGDVVLGTFPVDGSGTASVTTSSLSPGDDPITATYDGPAGYLSSSANLTQVVNPYATTVSLTLVSYRVGRKGRVYRLQAIVQIAGALGASAVPTGTVTFSRGNAHLGGRLLQGGIASFNLGRVRPRNKSFTATFLGSAEFTGSTVKEVL